ncbi:PA14 domain-containing protein [Streptomyces sp. NPDC090106]|uniref:PA14 domain-containing protein n=1 Tax=Streptomyces sp. NPDC090106 TaxID=3365946 RepID=UPI00382223CA
MNPARRTTAATALVLALTGPLLTVTPASAATSCASPVFKRQFFANTAFSGTPKKTDCDSAIDQSWSGAPASGLPSNNFGVRWSTTRDFGSGGPFTLTASGLDGIRVYLDSTRKISLWKNTTTTVSKTLNLTVPSGKHTLRVDYANWTGAAKVKFTYTPRTSATVDKVKPLTPTGVSVAYNKSTLKTKVSWAKNKEMDLAGYRVYRRLKGSTAWTKLTSATAVSYSDTPPPTGQTYYYEVRAYDKAGNESAGTADQAVTTVDKTPPAAPFVEQDVCATDDRLAGPELVTTAENKADIALYQAQRKDAATGAWTTVYEGTKGPFCDPGQPADGSVATYRGRARDAAGNWSAYSAATTFTLWDTVPPKAPEGAHITYEGGVPHLLWTADPAAATYQVLQLDPATGAYVDATDTATTTATDVELRQRAAVADTYRYAVRALDAKGNASAPAEVTLTMSGRAEAIAPFRTTASRFDEGVMIEWSSADPWTFGEDDPLLTYALVRTDRATGVSGGITACKPNSSQDLPLTDPDTYWTWNTGDAPGYAGARQINGVCWDVSGASETTYDYTVVTVDPYGHTSRPGPAATATTPDTVRPAPVENLAAETVPLGVRLTWTPPADDDVQGYRVWQSVTDPETGETRWAENCWTGDSLTGTEILCPTVPDGAAHTYKVAATDGSPLVDSYAGPEAFHPAELTVTLPDTRPPGWTGTEIREDQYPELYVGCSESSGLGDCDRFADYRVERWDPATAAYVTLSEGAMYDAVFFMDETVHEDTLGLYYYRVVRLDAEGAELSAVSSAYGVWDSWL